MAKVRKEVNDILLIINYGLLSLISIPHLSPLPTSSNARSARDTFPPTTQTTNHKYFFHCPPSALLFRHDRYPFQGGLSALRLALARFNLMSPFGPRFRSSVGMEISYIKSQRIVFPLPSFFILKYVVSLVLTDWPD
ncbi:hypothetical protein CNJ00495 [Cryptococcus deneoformans JEC21]|uniref:Uncharacterized protein n=1 Tax=Cryptococcus deneoformans (strain JEC21 / ATCC MYA-565) TaxID=214684 RepID=A0A0S2LJ15_CRYD1|nr:hypothetical protein CNJ00495 [Cryptococcus neoformans var. neoformans JEC21]ALO60894.1 hypothetical protein CNJ00495 [Cryptococcus neoformans var. neoformans JEC21]